MVGLASYRSLFYRLQLFKCLNQVRIMTVVFKQFCFLYRGAVFFRGYRLSLFLIVLVYCQFCKNVTVYSLTLEVPLPVSEQNFTCTFRACVKKSKYRNPRQIIDEKSYSIKQIQTLDLLCVPLAYCNKMSHYPNGPSYMSSLWK